MFCDECEKTNYIKDKIVYGVGVGRVYNIEWYMKIWKINVMEVIFGYNRFSSVYRVYVNIFDVGLFVLICRIIIQNRSNDPGLILNNIED